MSYIYLQEQGAECSAECFSGIPAYALSRLSLTAEKSSCSDNETECCRNSQSGTTCELLTANRGEGLSTSYAGASPAKTYLARGKARELTEQEAGYGANLPASFARYDQDTHSWKTAQCSLIEGLDEFSGTWPKSGIMRNGVCWELTMLIPCVREKECGYSLMRPTASDGMRTKFKLKSLVRNNHADGNLSEQLARVYRRKLTPKCAEILMLFPIGWTGLKPLATDKFRLWRQSHLNF